MDRNKNTRKKQEVLIIEDNFGDILYAKKMFKNAGIDNNFTIATTGEDALAKLASGYRPDLILLDMNLPKMHGKEVYAAIKETAALADIPITILSSHNDSNIEGADFMQKPLSIESVEKFRGETQIREKIAKIELDKAVNKEKWRVINYVCITSTLAVASFLGWFGNFLYSHFPAVRAGIETFIKVDTGVR